MCNTEKNQEEMQPELERYTNSMQSSRNKQKSHGDQLNVLPLIYTDRNPELTDDREEEDGAETLILLRRKSWTQS